MIRITHKVTGALLLELDGDSLDRADLSNRDLSYANLANCSLRAANLRNTNLSHADLSSANLSIDPDDVVPCGAILNGASLANANLTDANLQRAGLSKTNLNHANLSGTNLRDSYLKDADLSHATMASTVLTYANLMRADLRRASLTDVDLKCVSFRTANLDGTVFQNAVHAEEDAWPENYAVNRGQVSFWQPDLRFTEEFLSIRKETADCIWEAFRSETGEYGQNYLFDWEVICDYIHFFQNDHFWECFPAILVGMLQCDPDTLFRDHWMCILTVMGLLNVDYVQSDHYYASPAAHRPHAIAEHAYFKKSRNERFERTTQLQSTALLTWLFAMQDMPGADQSFEFEYDYLQAIKYWMKRAELGDLPN